LHIDTKQGSNPRLLWQVQSQIGCKALCQRYKARLNSHARNGRCIHKLHTQQSKAQLTSSQWEVHSHIAHRHKTRLNCHPHNGRCTHKLCNDTKQGSTHMLAMGGALTNFTYTQSKAQLTLSQWEMHSLIAHRNKARLTTHVHNGRCTHYLYTDTKQGSTHTRAKGGALTNGTQTQSKAQLTCSQWEVHSQIAH
jgi:hypothetical protein